MEIKNCKHCNAKFEITDKDLEFYEKVSPSFDGKKYSISTPSLCPECRLQRRLATRNEKKIYKRKCDATGENIISIYSPDKPYKVYNQDFWRSDKWDAMDYSINFDFSLSFFEQFKKLYSSIPKSPLFTGYLTMYNSDYCNCAGQCKNCYLCFEGDTAEDCYYVNLFNEGNIFNCIDCYNITDCNNCYECSDSHKLANCFFSDNSENCRDSLFLSNCFGCNNCFGCVNLRNKNYCIYNKQYSKDGYLIELKRYKNLKYLNLFNLRNYFFDEFILKFPRKSIHGNHNENSTGNYIYFSKDSNDCYLSNNIDNVSYGVLLSQLKNSRDHFSWGGYSENTLECISVGINCSNIYFCSKVRTNCNYVFYSDSCDNCSHCFGCVGLKNKSYCILNKQYTKEEYNSLVPKIIEHMQSSGEWGEFFPSSLSPFGYNETVANEYFPMTREEVLGEKVPVHSKGTGTKKGKIFNWSDYESPKPNVEKVIPASKLPEDISDIPDDILNWAIECEVTKKPFRIIREELEFYRKHNLSIPRKHPDQRHLDRMKLRNPRKLYDRVCHCPDCEENAKKSGNYKKEDFALNKNTGKLSKKIKTTYSSDRPEIVYCEECYNKEVY